MSDGKPLRTIRLSGDEPPAELAAIRGTLHVRYEALAQVIRGIYVLLFRHATGRHEYGEGAMAAWDGGEDRFGRRHTCVWPKIAAAVVELGADPLEFLQAQFRASAGKPPRPNALYGEKAERIFRRAYADARNHLRETVAQQLKSCQASVNIAVDAGWSDTSAMRYALCDRTTTDASALIRYVLASRFSFGDLTAMFYDEAMVEYVFQKPDFDAVLDQLIPADFQAAAAELRARLLGRRGI